MLRLRVVEPASGKYKGKVQALVIDSSRGKVQYNDEIKRRVGGRDDGEVKTVSHRPQSKTDDNAAEP